MNNTFLCRRFTTFALKWLLTLVILSFSPLIIIAALFLTSTRQLLTYWARFRRPELGSFLDGLDSIIAADSPYEKPAANISYVVKVQGRVELESLRAVVKTGIGKIRDLRYTNSGEDKRGNRKIKLEQHLTSWAGFSVWADEENFQVDDHVRLFSSEELNARVSHGHGHGHGYSLVKVGIPDRELEDRDLADLSHQLIPIPYPEKTSPWEILLLLPSTDSSGHSDKGSEDDGNVTSFLILRCHHALADGISLISLLSTFVDQPDVYSKTIAKFAPGNMKTPVKNWVSWISDNILGLPEFVEHQLVRRDENVWHPRDPAVTPGYHHIPFDVSLDQIRRFRRQNFTTPSVLLSATAIGIRRFMETRKISIPDAIHVSTIFGTERAPCEFTNRFWMGAVRLPLKDAGKSETVLKEIERNYRHVRATRMSVVTQTLTSFVGLFPKKGSVAPLLTTTGLCTNVPGFENPASITGRRIVSINGTANLPSSIRVVLYSFGDVDKLSLVLGVSTEIVADSTEAKKLSQLVQEEFTNLEKLLPPTRVQYFH